VTKSLSDIITEFVWTAAHNNKKYGLKELKIIQSMHPSIDINTLQRIILHAKRTPKEVSWDIVSQKQSIRRIK
tara:strand:+ start:134 stop:352 length:219 start_codon:yes stop_codon:yes gene_type:complete